MNETWSMQTSRVYRTQSMRPAWVRVERWKEAVAPGRPKRSAICIRRCAFCGRARHEVRKLVAGPGVYICDECIELCNDIVEDELAEETSPPLLENLPTPRPYARLPFYNLMNDQDVFAELTTAWDKLQASYRKARAN